MHAMKRSAPPSTSSKHAALVAQACRCIEAAEQPPALDDLAKEAGLSPFHFHRVFKAATGLTPKAYATAHRARAVRATLARGTSSVTDAIFDAGFNANSRFYEQADAMLASSAASARSRWATIPMRCCANCRIASRART
jgi:AraC family transcriptional regulator of adaptative response/methylated-DNA-[protein]-cysteine methyltransferase